MSEESEMRKGVREQILHLVEEEHRSVVACEQALGEPKLLDPLAPSRLVPILIRLTNAEERHAEPFGQHLAELGLAGSRRSVQEHVDARSTGIESAFQQPFDVVAIGGHVVEVGPLEVARGRGAEQQAVDVDAGVAGYGGKAVESVDEDEVTVIVDRDEPRTDERGVVSESAVNRVGRDSKEHGQRRALEVERVDVSSGPAEDVVDHRFDDRLCLVPQQKLDDAQVGCV